MSKFKVGQSVRIYSKHWRRPMAAGIIVEYQALRRSDHKWLVRFEEDIEGGGFHEESRGEGQFLWFMENELEEKEEL